MDNKTTNSALGFLIWFRKFYGGECSKVFRDIAEDYKQRNLVTVRAYLLELTDKGYVEVVDKNCGRHSRKFRVIEEKFMELI